jgi:hypothetical protein
MSKVAGFFAQEETGKAKASDASAHGEVGQAGGGMSEVAGFLAQEETGKVKADSVPASVEAGKEKAGVCLQLGKPARQKKT